MSFTELLEHVGSMGRFQVLFTTLLAMPVFMMASHILLQNFTAATPEHHCLLLRSNDTHGGNWSAEDREFLKMAIPVDKEQRLDQCRRFATVQGWLWSPNATEGNRTERETETCNDGWTYDRRVFPNTIVTEWDLVCASRTLKHLAQSLYMAGVLLGGIVFGGLSDRFGRRLVLVWCYLQVAVTGTATAFSPTFRVYCALRFLTGMAFSGIVFNCVSMCVEWTPTRTRALLGTFHGIAYTTGQILLAGLAYLIPDWRWLQFTVSLPFFLFFLYSWWIPESARWLVMAGKPDQAVKELKKVAKMNGRDKAGDQLNLEFLRSHMKEEMEGTKPTYSVWGLVRTPSMRRISFCLCFVWFSTTFAYYGLVMDLQNFGTNIYLIQVIFGAVDFPAKLISVLCISFIGRRVTQASSLMLAGLTILANMFIPQDMQTLRTAFAVFGKGCLSASFNCIYLYTGELYPTVIRQTGLGLCNTVARLGGMVAPVAKMASEYAPFLPYVIYGTAPIVSAAAAAFLPETLNVPIPETIEQVESRSRGRREEEKQSQLQAPLNSAMPETENVSVEEEKQAVY